MKIRGTPDVGAECQEIESGLAKEAGGRWADLLSEAVQPALIVSLALAIFDQLTDINIDIYYAPTIMRFAGLSSASIAVLATAGVGTVNMLTTIVAPFLVDRLGRRLLLLGACSGSSLAQQAHTQFLNLRPMLAALARP